MKNQVDFYLPLKLQKYAILCYASKYSWPINLQDFCTFDLFDLLILKLGVHCYIVLNES